MNFSYRLKPIVLGIAAVAMSISLVACDSCKEEPPPAPPEPEPEVKVEEPEPVDPLAEEKAEAEKLGESQAILTGDTARAVSAAIEALAATPEQPRREPQPARPKVGTVDKGALSKAFAAHDDSMRKCYERALKGSPMLQGKIRLNVVIAPTGVAEDVEAQPMSLRDPVVAECMERVAKAISFPQPSGGSVPVNKVYAFFPDM